MAAVARPCSVIFLDEPGAGLSRDETEELLTLVFGLDPEHHPLPSWLADWSAAASLPPRREPTPSVWD